MAKQKTDSDYTPQLDVSAPRSMRVAGRVTSLLLAAFLIGLFYLAYVLVSHSPFYMSKSGATGYGTVYDRTGDVLFDGTKPLSSYPAGQFADVGNLIGDASGQMANTLVGRNLSRLANYNFLYGKEQGQVSLHTTLSHKANKAVYWKLGKKNGTVIACNWKTGELLCCVSKPCVDIAKGYDNIDALPENSLLCKAFYPTVPGSTQKVSTLAAAYEKLGVSAVNQMQFSCTGTWINAKGQAIKCHEAKGHGTQTLTQAFRNSCNPFFAQLVQSAKLPLSAVIETYTRMGYSVNGAKADSMSLDGITIAPASTTLTDAKDFDTQWGCLGQGTTLVSPYQLMLWECAIANGTGTAQKPYLISSRTDVDGKYSPVHSAGKTDSFFSAETAKAIQAVMTENARTQYSYSLGKYTCGVKSGTAQVEQNGKAYENSLLAGFCLDEKCPVAFCVVIEERVNGELTTAQLTKTLLDALSGINSQK